MNSLSKLEIRTQRPGILQSWAKLIFACSLALFSLPAAAAERRVAYAEVDGGAVFQGVNDVEIPSGAATRFSLASFSAGPWPTG